MTNDKKANENVVEQKQHFRLDTAIPRPKLLIFPSFNLKITVTITKKENLSRKLSARIFPKTIVSQHLFPSLLLIDVPGVPPEYAANVEIAYILSQGLAVKETLTTI